MRIFWDVDTQNDFMNKDGALYVPDAEKIKSNLYNLTGHANSNGIPIFGSVDRHFGTEEYKHREGELKRWGGPFPDHCMFDTKGEQKIRETNSGQEWVPSWVVMYGNNHENDSSFYIAHINPEAQRVHDILYWAADVNKINDQIWYPDEASKKIVSDNRKVPDFRPVFIEKQSYDVFTNPAADFFLTLIDPVTHEQIIKEAVVYGVATDYCVKAAVLGMQERGIQTYVVKDAITGITQDGEKSALEEMTAAGAKFVTTREVVGDVQ